MQAATARVAERTRRHWSDSQDTHVAPAPYYLRVRAVLPLLCELHLDADDRVLDAGCGDGEYTAVIARHAAHVDAFDLAPALIARAEARGLANVNFHLHDLEHLDAQPAHEPYDAIFAMGLFVTLHGDDFDRAVGRLHRHLKPGGLLITRDSVARADEDVVRRVQGDYHAHYRSPANFVRPFAQLGLRMERCVYLESFSVADNHFFVFRRG